MTAERPAGTLALIPARGGSKGVPQKNLRSVAGRPLLDWTIAAAVASKRVSRVVVSTDDPDIAQVAADCGAEVPFLRPASLATDEATTMGVVHHALEQLEPSPELVVLLQPTSPLRTAADIDAAIELCIRNGGVSCVAVTEAAKSPYWMYRMSHDARLQPVLEPPGGTASRRQDLPPVFVVNGALYVARADWVAGVDSFVAPDTVGYVMPTERSLDIDTELDFVFLEALLERGNHATLP